MTNGPNLKPTEKELEILQVLWQKGPSTVREVFDVLSISKKSGVGYTTILKLMQIMFEKGILERIKEGKTHTYSVVIERIDTQKHMVSSMIDKVFQGSALDLVMQALGDSRTSSKDLDEVKAYLKTLDKDKNERGDG